MMFFCQPEGVYIMLDQCLLRVLTPGFNQSSRGMSGKCSSPVCVSVSSLLGLAMACLLGVYGLSPYFPILS